MPAIKETIVPFKCTLRKREMRSRPAFKTALLTHARVCFQFLFQTFMAFRLAINKAIIPIGSKTNECKLMRKSNTFCSPRRLLKLMQENKDKQRVQNTMSK